jgi:hypothetical protein
LGGDTAALLATGNRRALLRRRGFVRNPRA